MGPCLVCYVSSESHLALGIEIDLLLDKISNTNLNRSRKGNYWEVFFSNYLFTISIKEADLDEMVDDFIIEKIELKPQSLNQPIFNLSVCCNGKNEEMNNIFINQFLHHVKRKSINIIGLIGHQEFRLNL